jgi:hypothetical protein
MREQLVFSGIGLLSILVGAPLAVRRVPRNRWYGLRIPATFADEEVWYEANAAMGRDLIVLGGVELLVVLALPRMGLGSRPVYGAVCATVFATGSLVATMRGWRLANRLLRERRSTTGPSGATRS